MSHTASIDTQFKDLEVLERVCREKGIQLRTHLTEVQLFSGKYQVVAAFQLPEWHYMVGVQANGSVIFDNYGGQWGNIEQLHHVIQKYACEKTKKEAYLAGYSVRELVNEDGSIELLIDE
jgi:hypothetical protein